MIKPIIKKNFENNLNILYRLSFTVSVVIRL